MARTKADPFTKLAVRPPEAAAMLSVSVDEMWTLGVRPSVQRSRLTLIDVRELQRVMDELAATAGLDFPARRR